MSGTLTPRTDTIEEDQMHEHAEQLERELSTAQARIAELEGALKNLTDTADELGRVCNRGECDDQIKVARDLLAMKGGI